MVVVVIVEVVFLEDSTRLMAVLRLVAACLATLETISRPQQQQEIPNHQYLVPLLVIKAIKAIKAIKVEACSVVETPLLQVALAAPVYLA